MPKKPLLPSNRRIVPILFAVVAFLSSGCTKKEQPATQPVAAAKPVAPAAAKPVQKQLSTAKVPENVAAQFDFGTKRDPFKPFIVQPLSTPKAAQKALPGRGQGDLLPIQSYDVTKFRIAGIIANLKENRALVIDPAGKAYVVKQGMPIGNNNGFITKISPTYIEVLESYREDTGRIRKRTIKLTLPHKK